MKLEAAFGRERLFMDVEGYIRPGDDFVQILDGQVAKCDILLAVIGPRWLDTRDSENQRRLENPDDFVRIEIVSALTRGKRVIPLLVNNSHMPGYNSLPDDLKPFARRNAIILSHERFGSDCDRLIKDLKVFFETAEAAPTDNAASNLKETPQAEIGSPADTSAKSSLSTSVSQSEVDRQERSAPADSGVDGKEGFEAHWVEAAEQLLKSFRSESAQGQPVGKEAEQNPTAIAPHRVEEPLPEPSSEREPSSPGDTLRSVTDEAPQDLGDSADQAKIESKGPVRQPETITPPLDAGIDPPEPRVEPAEPWSSTEHSPQAAAAITSESPTFGRSNELVRSASSQRPVRLIAAVIAPFLIASVTGVAYWSSNGWFNVGNPPSAIQPEQTVTKPKIQDRIERPSASTPSPSPTDSRAAAGQSRVVAYEEDPADPQGKRFVGSATWRTDMVSPGPGQAPEPAIRADLEIPDRRMTVTMLIRRNTDPTLPASHTIELMFNLPKDFPLGGISNVPILLMKEEEQSRGTALAGLVVKVTPTFFLIGLSSGESEVKQNVALLRERAWFDVPIVYSNNRRGIVALEKGAAGERAFTEAFAAWDRAPQAVVETSKKSGKK